MSIWESKVSEITEKFDGLVADHKTTAMLLCGLGALVVAKRTLSSIRSLYRTFIRPSKNLFKRYQGGYVVVTGATFGLGKEYATQFAKKGFNLVLIARSQDRLDKSKSDILEVAPSADIKTIVFDFDVPYTEENYKGLIDELNKINDISVLINNVGCMYLGPFENSDINQISSMIQVNCIPCTIITRTLLPKMLNRSKTEGKRCGIMNISSVSARTKLKFAAVYAATKSYNEVFSNILTKEVGEFVDVMAVHPGPTKTNMIRFMGPFVATPTQHVSWVLSDLGYNDQTFGYYQHYLYCQAYRVPYFGVWYTWMRNSIKLDPIE